MLASQDECEIAKEMPSQGKDVVSLKLCSEIVIKKKLRISKRRICLVLKRSVDKRNLFVLERGICFVWKRYKPK